MVLHSWRKQGKGKSRTDKPQSKTNLTKRNRRLLAVEPLEDRTLMAFNLTSLPTWTDQGPGRVINSSNPQGLAQNNQVVGAIEALAPHPSNPDILYAGSVNGGIWKTINATNANPTWTPQTDIFGSLSISDIAISPLDATGNTVYAATTSKSSGNLDGGPSIGLLRTTNGGTNWTVVGAATLASHIIERVLPTSLLLPPPPDVAAQQIVLVAASDATGGIFRSADGGNTYTRISGAAGSGLPNAGVTDVVRDPLNSLRYYTAIPGQGIFRTLDGGLTWAAVNTGITTGLDGANARTLLAVHANAGAGTNTVWAVFANNQQLTAVYLSKDFGANWTLMGLPGDNDGGVNPGNEALLHLSVAADPLNQNFVFLGGDRQPVNANTNSYPNVTGAKGPSGRHFRGDASLPSGSQWISLDAAGAAGAGSPVGGTSPHNDSRFMIFDANNNILEGNDGGVYRLRSPNTTAQRRWDSVIGNLRVTETYQVGYDTLNHTVLASTQDNGSVESTNSVFSLNTIFREALATEGGVAAVDNLSSPGFSLHYSSTPFLNNFTRRTVNAANTLILTEPVGLFVNGTGGTLIQTDTNRLYIQPLVLNKLNPGRMLIGTTKIYESFDRGETLDILLETSQQIGGIAYGGRKNGVDNQAVFYVGSGARIFRRTTEGGTITLLNTYAGSAVVDIVMDPDDYDRLYVLDANSRIWTSGDGGATAFVNITANLPSFFTGTFQIPNNLRTLEVYTPTNAVGDTELLVGGLGGVYRTINPTSGANTVWAQYGVSSNAITTDMHYSPEDNVFLIGTFGRGTWTVQNASNSLITDLTITGDNNAPNQNDVIRIARNAGNPALLDVFVNSATPTFTTALSLVRSITVQGLGGNDTLQIDYSNGTFFPVNGINLDGGTGTDTVSVQVDADQTLTDASLAILGVGSVALANMEQASLTGGPSANTFDLNFSGSATLNGLDGNDTYLVQLQGAGTRVTTVSDTGVAGTDLLTVRGTAQVDTFNISAAQVVRANETVAFAGLEGVTVAAGGNNDTINVLATSAGVPVTVLGEAGNDTVVVGQANSVDGVQSQLTVDGGAGTNTITLADNGDLTSDHITITSTQVGTASNDTFFGLGGGLTYTGISVLTVNSGNCIVRVNSTASGTTTNINTGAGNNAVTIGENNLLSGIQSPLNVNSQGTVVIAMLDMAETQSKFVTLTNTTVGADPSDNFFGPGGSLQFFKSAGVNLRMGAGDDLVQVKSSPASSLYSIATGPGDDTVVIGNDVGASGMNVNGIVSEVDVFGQEGTDTLIINDTDSTSDGINKTATLDFMTAVGGPGVGTIGAGTGDNFFGPNGYLVYGELDSLTLDAAGGNDKFFINATLAGTNINLNTGAGNDNVTVGSGHGGSGGTVAGIVSQLNIDGQAGTNTLRVSNDGDTTTDLVTITATDIGRGGNDSFFPAGGGISYAGMNSVTVDSSKADQGDRLIVVPSQTTTINVNAGAPVPPTTTGDLLLLNLSGVTNPVQIPGGTGSGTWTFGNRQNVNYTGIEDQNTVSAIRGQVFEDIFADGKDAFDPGMPGVIVRLLDVNNNNAEVAQQITDAQGNYTFFATPGSYRVTEDIPAGFTRVTGTPPQINIVFAGPDVNNVDFGNFDLYSVSGEVFLDNNGDGVKNGADAGLQDWRIELHTPSVIQDLQHTLTNATGFYSFDNLGPSPDGEFSILRRGQAGFFATTPNEVIFIPQSGQDVSISFGVFQLVSYTGQVYQDFNGNGTKDAGDTGIANVTLFFDTNGNGVLEAGETSVVTDASGNYVFNNVQPGSYLIRQVKPAGVLQTTADPAAIVASSGVNLSGIDFGDFQLVTISGQKYLDANANGTREGSETGLQGWTIFLDADGSGTLNGNEASQVTDAFGKYSFSGLTPGSYTVREVPQAGWQQTSANPAAIQATSGTNPANVDFGNFKLIAITGTKFSDLNGNGIRDANDVGLPGWTIFLDANDDGVLQAGEASTTTDASGNFQFSQAKPVNARLAEVLQAGWSKTTQNTLVSLTSGQTFAENIGNFKTITVSGRAFVDSDANGNDNSGTEPGRNGVTIELYRDVNVNGQFDQGTDTLVSTQITANIGGADGRYQYTNLGQGSYLVRAVRQAGRTPTTPAAGIYAFTITSGNNVTGRDFGSLLGQTQSFVYQVYLDLLNRTVDASGIGFWSGVIDRGTPRSEMVKQLQLTGEYRANVVNDLYIRLLGRSAEATAITFGVGVLSSTPPAGAPTPVQQLTAIVMGSDEYFQRRANASNATFVQVMFQDATGSPIDPETEARLNQDLANGRSRDAVSLQVLRDIRSYQETVRDAYFTYLHRAVEQSGLDYFVSALSRGLREEDVYASVIGSDEYFAKL